MLFCMLSTFFAQEVAACCTSIPKSLQKKSLLFNFLSKFQIFLMFLSYVMVIAIGGIIFQSFGYSKTPTNEVVHWDFSEAFYFCWVTAATIGYGDFTIQSTSGRQWVNLFSIFGIAMLSLVLTQITSIKAYADKKIEEMRRKKEVPTLHPQITNLAPTLPPEMEDFLYATLDQLSDFDPAEQTHFLDIFQKLTTLNKDTTLKPHKDQEEDKEQEDQIELQLIK
uniref:Potassium channel domain-containing protein n=1 Tax=Arcella intermedia TaxID=1963864 RepID=A0A6B2LEJ7_9EUKA|eukprot:TRINITY_DN8724_c0_g1_i2.p1 TRINITY_DN8724_c0_g1~~TRINITY_DN8724_c0_g1_i2.p1  ORF type:complete len:223 (-),score=63.80 TRINITY_DN8724_c0_g1_i2:5-673(-)